MVYFLKDSFRVWVALKPVKVLDMKRAFDMIDEVAVAGWWFQMNHTLFKIKQGRLNRTEHALRFLQRDTEYMWFGLGTMSLQDFNFVKDGLKCDAVNLAVANRKSISLSLSLCIQHLWQHV